MPEEYAAKLGPQDRRLSTENTTPVYSENPQFLVFQANFRHFLASNFSNSERMAAFDTFEWFIRRFFPHPSDQELAFLARERAALLAMRNENERVKHVDSLIAQVKEEAGNVAP